MRILFILLVLFILGTSIPVRAETVKLRFDDLPELVRAQNGTVKAGESYVKGADSQTGHLVRSFLPRVGASGGGEIFQTGVSDRTTQPVGEVGGKLNLFHGGKDALEEKTLQAKRRLAETNAAQSYLRELTRARFLYADVIYYEELLKGMRTTSSLTQEQSALVGKQIEAGLVPESDGLEFKIFANRMSQEKILAEEDHEHAEAELKAVLGLPHDAQLRLSGISFRDKELLAAEPDPASHPEVALLKGKAEISRNQKKQAERWWAPSLDVYGSYALYPSYEREFAQLKNRDEAVGGVRLSLDLFDGLQSSSLAKAFKHQSTGLNLEAKQKEREIEVLFEKLKHELKSRRQLLGLLTESNALNRNYLETSRDEYGRGVKTGPQWLEASRESWEEKRRLAETRREYVQILSALSALLGR